MDKYFGKYVRFETESKKAASGLLGADNLIGDVYDIVVEIVDGAQKAWLVSRFDERVGFFEPELSRKVSIMQAQGMTCKAVLAFVAFTDHPDDGVYWGKVALVCFNPAYADEFGAFLQKLSAKLADDVHPKIDLSGERVEKVIETGGEWFPTQTSSITSKEKGTAIVKRRRSMTDKLVEQGRAGNKGCYVLSWVFLLALVAGIVFVAMKVL